MYVHPFCVFFFALEGKSLTKTVDEHMRGCVLPVHVLRESLRRSSVSEDICSNEVFNEQGYALRLLGYYHL